MGLVYRMATIQDVAKMAGVSVATVSRVINNSTSVVEETRENVLQAIKKLNYEPNLLGRNLRRSQTKMILVLLPNIANPFYSKIVKGIEDVGHKNGYNVMLCNTNSNRDREKVYLEMLKNKLYDGVIFMAPELTKEELSLIGMSYPVVQCCEYKEGTAVSHVSIDNFQASYKAVSHLISLGHKKIGIISCKSKFVSTKQREEGYKKALEDSGLKFGTEFIEYGDYSFKSGLRAAKQMLNRIDKPTAIFSISDMMAIGALRAVKEEGLKVPYDVAVVGFDNISFSAMCDPRLTTIAQPKYDLGCAAMELLIKQIKGELKEPKDISMEYELLIRESSIK
jgi:LacI family transcriptional regulator, repressor for deo operon, udp, cdd, tsx, nupC, and nupG